MEDIVSFSREALELDDGQESIRYLERIFELAMIVETAMRFDE